MITRENLTDKVKKEILNMVFQKGLSMGEKLPSIAEMADMLSVSKTTVREAIRSLEQLHFLEVKQGRGVFLAVDSKSLGKNITQLRSVTEMAQESGIELETFEWHIKDIKADIFLADKLKVEEGSPLVFLSRVRGFDEEVAVYLEDILLKELVSDFTPLDWEGSLFKALEQRGVFVSYSVAQIIPYVPDGGFVEKTKVNSDTPFLLLEQLHFNSLGREIAFSRDYYHSEYFHFEVVRKRI
ncbi:MAG: GntR family transcriptional regulator [Candidatus Atribacteria bacterium]|nr:GntR family transcriptional regulator [Candidatus Atribacteria bacterium]